MIKCLLRRYRKFLKQLEEYEIICRALDPSSEWEFAEEKNPPEPGHYFVIVKNVDDVLRPSSANYLASGEWDQNVMFWRKREENEKVHVTGRQNP